MGHTVVGSKRPCVSVSERPPAVLLWRERCPGKSVRPVNTVRPDMTWGSILRSAVGCVLGPALLLLGGSAAGDTLALESRSMSLDHSGTRSMLGSVKRWGCQFQKVHLAEIEASDLDMIVLD